MGLDNPGHAESTKKTPGILKALFDASKSLFFIRLAIVLIIGVIAIIVSVLN